MCALNIGWTEEQHNLLMSMMNDGMSDQDIADAVSEIGPRRSRGSVEGYRIKFGLRRIKGRGPDSGRAVPGQIPAKRFSKRKDEMTDEDFDNQFVAAMAAIGFERGSSPFAGPHERDLPERTVPVRVSRPVGSLGTGWQI